MSVASRIVLSPLIALALGAAACGGLSSGPHKVVLNENVCASARFLRMTLGETNRVVLDNKHHSELQTGMTATFDRFPVDVQGEVPEGSVIGDNVSTIRLRAAPGEQSQVDLVPKYTGTYKLTCGTAVKEKSGSQVRQTDIDVQIVQ